MKINHRRKIKYRRKIVCPVCNDNAKPIAIEAEHLRPLREDQPHTQFIITGRCNHEWKMSAKEMGYDTVLGFIKPTIRERLRGIFA